MVAQQQKVRLHFLIALTLAVGAFGVTRGLRTYRETRVRTEYVRTERALHEYTSAILRAEQEMLQDFALAERGRIQRDAAALLMQARYLMEQGSAAGGARGIGAARALEQIEANFGRLQAGQTLSFPKGQAFLRGYHAEVDGSFQPYSICVPRSYRGDRPIPLIIALHGLMGFKPYQCQEAASYQGAISVKPEGRRATDYMHIGEDDVLAVLEEVCQLYAIDRSRVYLTGHSMGGTGSWNLAVHYPHLFAGIVPVGGNVGRQASEPDAGGAGAGLTHAGLRAFLHASRAPVSYAQNLEHCRILAVHGAGDDPVPVERARSMAQRLREVNDQFEYLEFPQAAQGQFPAWVQEYATSKVFGGPPAGTPTSFRYKTAHLRHNRAWWIRLDRLDDPVRFATVTARASDGSVEITTDNVCALTVLLDEAPTEAGLIRVDGTEFPVPSEVAGRRYSLEKWDGSWRVAQAGSASTRPSSSQAGGLKRKGLSGPLSDIFRDPFLVVYGTAGSSEPLKEISRREAERFAADWQMRYGSPPRLKADSEVTDEDSESFNLMLFGGPQVNEVARKVAQGLPVRVEDGVIVLGDDRYSGQDTGAFLCYPNPLNPRRMIGLVAGTTPAALYQVYDRTGLWFDWDVYDRYKWFDYAVFDNKTIGPETFLTVGFFDNQWQLPGAGSSPAGGGAAWKSDPKARAALRPQGFPRLKRAADSDQSQVILSDVMPVKIEQHNGAVGFDRSYAGKLIQLGEETFEKGLGVKAPSSVSFVLGREFRRFSATVGLTRGPKTEPSRAHIEAKQVVFEVWGDGRLLAASPRLTWREPELPRARLSADTRGVSVLTLKARLVGDGTWAYGTCAWGQPTVTR